MALPGVRSCSRSCSRFRSRRGSPSSIDFQRELYFGVLLSTALSTALLIAPSANHRLLFRMRDKEYLVRVSNRLTIAGLAVLSLSLIGAILLISDILFKSPAPLIFTAATAPVFAILWVILPLARRIRLSESEQS